MYLSLSDVSLIVKFSHKLLYTCLDAFASKVLPVPPQRDCSFEAVTGLQIFLTFNFFYEVPLPL